MTDATTADVLAAWELIEKHGLSPIPGISGWAIACGDATPGTSRQSLASAVRAWAEGAGVPWPSVNVVPMWAVVDETGEATDCGSRESAEDVVLHLGGTVVPCEVVIRTETEATP